MTLAGRLLLAGVVVVASSIVGACSGATSDRTSGSAPVTTLVTVTGASTSVVSSGRGDLGDLTTKALSTLSPAGLRFDGCVLVADAPEERATGLMDRSDVGRFTGMAFVYDADTTTEFWMYQTLIPLSIAFIDGTGRVVSTADMEPCPSSDASTCERYGSSQPYRTAIEVPAGQLRSAGLVEGASATLGAPC